MRANDWIDPPVESLLDVGCNVGAWLSDCSGRYPGATLAGVDINQSALQKGRARWPGIEFLQADAHHLPFHDATFQYVTCIETLEHLEPQIRAAVLGEIRRILRPGGRLIVAVPHAGWFAGLDSNNIRFRFPRLYRRLIGHGLRDDPYAALNRDVQWHHHFTEEELRDLAGADWNVVAIRRKGLILYPLTDWLSWPLYRLRLFDHPLRLLLQRIAGWEYSIDFGRASYGIMMLFERR
jgi:SAM-dependent methyltransferase